MDMGLEGRACIVTGAGSGIGLATARELRAEGADVLLVGRDEAALARAAAEAVEGADTAGRAETLAADITDADAATRIAAACEERFGTIDVLVNNAGTSRMRSLQELTDEDWRAQWELNVMGPMRLMRAVAPAMATRGQGRIVNVSSSSGKRPSQANAAYSVAKAAELSLSRVFADAYARDGVLVNAVAPGVVASPLWTAPGGLADQTAERQGDDREAVLKAVSERNPLGRMGTEQEIAAVIVFLCSARSSNVTGAAWSVDGGTVSIIV